MKKTGSNQAMRCKILRHFSAFLFCLSLSNSFVSEQTQFSELVTEFEATRADCMKKIDECTQKYIENSKKIALGASQTLADVLQKALECHGDVRAKASYGTSDYQKKAARCNEEFDYLSGEAFKRSPEEDLTKERQKIQNDIAKFDTAVDEELFGMFRTTTGQVLNVQEETKLQTFKNEQEQAKRGHAKLLRDLEMEFYESVCVDVNNAQRELYQHEADYLARLIMHFMNKDLTDLGLDFHLFDLHQQNQSLARVEETGTSVLHTKWLGKVGCKTCITGSVKSGGRKVRNLENEYHKSALHRFLEEIEIDKLPSVQQVVQLVFETRLDKAVQEARIGTPITQKSATASAKPCGVWPLTSPLVTVNPEQLWEIQEFQQAHGMIIVADAEETQKYEKDIEKVFVNHQEQRGREELKYMSCMNEVDEDVIRKNLPVSEKIVLYGKCFEQYDEEENDIREKYIQSVEKQKEHFLRRKSDMDKKVTHMVKKLDIKIVEAEKTDKIDGRGKEYIKEIEKERDAETQTVMKIEKEQEKLHQIFKEGITCEIDHLKREFYSDEIPILTDLVQRGANFAFDMCNIDLHMYAATLIDQEFDSDPDLDDRRRLERFGLERRLGSRLTVRFNSLCECTRCSTCDASSNTVGGTCDCCLRRRTSTADSYRRTSEKEDCFEEYLTPRVKRLVEARLKNAMEDGAREVDVECRISHLNDD